MNAGSKKRRASSTIYLFNTRSKERCKAALLNDKIDPNDQTPTLSKENPF